MLDIWSSAKNLGRCVPRVPDPGLVGSVGKFRSTEVRRAAYDVWVLLPFVVGAGLSTFVADLFCRVGIPVRTGGRGIADDAWSSNLLVRSLTLGARAELFIFAAALSIGAETDRVEVRPTPLLEETTGCLAVVPFPLERKDC